MKLLLFLLLVSFHLSFGFSSGDGTVDDPYQLSTRSHLESIRDLSARYVLMNDIDLNDALYDTALIARNADPDVPEFSGDAFTGHFDGQGFVIRNLRISGDNKHFVGLFGKIGPGGVVTHLGVEEADISGGSHVGILAAANEGVVAHSYSEGVVTASDAVSGGLVGDSSGLLYRSYSGAAVNGVDVTGGLVGYNLGEIITCYATGPVTSSVGHVGGLAGRSSGGGSVTDSYATGAVTGSGNYIGGLIGRSNNCAIVRCYATGDVLALGSAGYVGGLAGRIELSASHSYSLGSVTATSSNRIGGFAGRINDNAFVVNCFSIGLVNAPPGTTVGGFSGETRVGQGAVVEGCFWDTTTSGQARSSSGAGKATEAMHAVETYVSAGWSFDQLWRISDGHSYPELAWQFAGGSDSDINYHLVYPPYEFGTYQHKVQLHTHTTVSDGEYSPQWVMQAYEDLGYTAVAITDHWYHDDRWGYLPSLDSPEGHNIIHISGVEYSSNNTGSGWAHMLGININTIYKVAGGGARQAQIDQAILEGGLTYIAHPTHVQLRGWTDTELLSVSNYTGVEIYNSHSRQDFQNRDVDFLLYNGKRPLLIAISDFHRNIERLEGGFVVVLSNNDIHQITADEIVTALKSGNYFSAGRKNTDMPFPPYFTDIAVDGKTITVKVDKPVDIQFITRSFNNYIEGPNYAYAAFGVKEAEYTVSCDDGFVRIKAIYTEDGEQSYAWSNPFYVTIEKAGHASGVSGSR